MRTSEDALRSVRRFVASALGSPPWRVRLTMDSRFERPAALVQVPTPSPWQPGGVDTVQASLAIFVQLFPEVGRTGSESKVLAERAADKLTIALTLGVQDAWESTVRSYRDRIPLWDYTDSEGEPLPVEGKRSIATKRLARDYLRVAPGYTIQTLPMAADEQLFTAICDLRVQWFRNARLGAGGPLLESVEVDAKPDVTIEVGG